MPAPGRCGQLRELEVGAERDQRRATRRPPRAARISSHCSTRTTPAHTGIRSAPRSVRARAASSRSLRSSKRETEARRIDGRPGVGHALGHLVGQRPDLGVHPGSLHRRGLRDRGARGAGELLADRAEVEVKPLERVGPQPRDPGDQRPAGGPVGPRSWSSSAPRRPPWARRLRRPERRRGPRPAPWAGARALARPVAASSFAAAARRSASTRARDRLLGRHPPGDLRPQLVDAARRAGPRSPAPARRPGRPGPAGDVRRPASALAVLRGHGVDVVEDDQHHVGVVGHRREVPVVDGGVGVLLRVEHPHQQVGQLDQPVDLEVVGDLGGVVVGQVEEDDALEGVVGADGPEHRVAQRLVPRLGCRATPAAPPRPPGPRRRRSPTTWSAGARRPRTGRAR